MAIKSAWAYRNGQQQLKEAIESGKDPKTGWIQKNGVLLYAERYEPTGKLMVKTYSSKKQADAVAERVGGERSFKWPYAIIK